MIFCNAILKLGDRPLLVFTEWLAALAAEKQGEVIIKFLLRKELYTSNPIYRDHFPIPSLFEKSLGFFERLQRVFEVLNTANTVRMSRCQDTFR